jgi:hypothetical protein
MDRLNHLDGALGWLWRLLMRALREGESYVIITLTGTSPPRPDPADPRYRDWAECRAHVDYDGVARRPQARALLDRLVAQPQVLLPRSLGRGRELRGVEPLGPVPALPMDRLRPLRRKLSVS